MLSSVLTSERAVQVNVEIMRTFVRLREILATHKDLARKLEELEIAVALRPAYRQAGSSRGRVTRSE